MKSKGINANLEIVPSGLSKAEIDSLAEDVASHLTVPSQNIISFVEKLGGSVEFHKIVEDGSLRVFGPKEFEIHLSSHTTPSMNRFTIAHELGHYLLHSHVGKVPVCATHMNYNTLDEIEANWFALAFLMPKDGLNQALKISHDPDYIGSVFKVTPAVAEARIESLTHD